MLELRNFKLLVKNKATGTPLKMYYIQVKGSGQNCSVALKIIIYIGVGLSALLVLTNRAMRRP